MKSTGQAPEVNDKDSGVLSNPLSFVHSGFYYWPISSLGSRGGAGLTWSRRSSDGTSSNYLHFSDTGLNPYGENVHGYGFAVRCVQILHHSH